MPNVKSSNPATQKAYIVTGPTSGIGRSTALELAKLGTVILVGRDRQKLADLQKTIEKMGQRAVSVICDLSEPASVRHAVAEIISLHLPIVGLVNNAGIRQQRPTKNSFGWDMTFATNHIGPFLLTEELIPHLADDVNIVFLVSAVEDPARSLAKRFGFRGGRYISAEASARGEWKPGGSKNPGFDAYATSKQCSLATVLEFAHEIPRLRFSALEPGLNPGTGLEREANIFLRFFAKYLLAPLAPLIPHMSTSKRTASVITKILTNESGQTGIYYDERGRPMTGSELVRNPKFTARVVAETRALLVGV
jgi:NAD(P)-dependent dehydrogenase (short-subunit alcohol dehydrogenase family)